MKILVTGATGFIGNHVVQNLLTDKNIEIITTSRTIEKAKKLKWFDKTKYVQCDLNESKKNFYAFFNKPDLLIHLAWEGLPNFNELYHIERNLHTNYNFIKNMIENGLKELNITGTCLEYGMVNGCLKEDLITKPVVIYGIGKDTLRRFIQELHKKYNFNYKWIRLFYVYGKGQTPKSIIPQLDKALDNNEEAFNMSGGEQLRDYLSVETMADYIVQISIQSKIYGIINCCSGVPISIKQLVENHMKKRGRLIKLNLGYYPYPDYEPMEFWGDNLKLKSIILNKSEKF